MRDRIYPRRNMEPHHRRRYNEAYTEQFYADYVAELERRLATKIPFRVAETPFFIPPALRDSLARDAREIVEQITKPALIAELKKAIPPKYDVPRMDALPNCLQVDFAITKDKSGELRGKVVELQAFPSLYALMVVQSRVMADLLKSKMQIEGPWSIYFSGLDEPRKRGQRDDGAPRSPSRDAKDLSRLRRHEAPYGR
jgi:hypothetical protein